ncbi:MAG: 50S ribosomal protein L31 [Candidatus Coatesbacteria bacterium]|nr:MAG: 50S ribosomal protein L31 [Candidatus Coatesbacteria bacterium]
MRKGIHPEYELAIIRCACGNEVEIRTTRPGTNVEICANCHPFYTGKQKLVDTAGRVDRFRKRYGLTDEASTSEAIARGEKLRQDKETRTSKKKKAKAAPEAQTLKPAPRKAAAPKGRKRESAKPATGEEPAAPAEAEAPSAPPAEEAAADEKK